MADEMFRAPIHRGMRVLDRTKFAKIVPLKAARIFDNKNISRVRSELERSKDALVRERLGSVHPDPDAELAKAGRKCILLRPEVATRQSPPPVSQDANGQSDALGGDDADVSWPHSPTVTELVRQELIAVVPFELRLDYTYWTYHDIISAILPENDQGEIPSGFSQVGHVAHLNLRDQYLQYKHLIAEILRDKNPGVKTVINKIDDVGGENAYRTFKYEVLVGEDDLNVTISEEGCTFRFDYSKVYWNSRLDTEHRRLVTLFKPSEAVCDVMSGIGPFAVPAGKKGVFVWANDLNPESYACLTDAVQRNKVGKYVRAFNEDGRTFIRSASKQLAEMSYGVDILSKPSKKDTAAKTKPEVLRTIHQPRTFQHFVMNLPAIALTFLPSFIGLYPPSVRQHLPADFQMPLVHVHCFSTKSDDNVEEGVKICEEISKQLGYDVRPGKIDEDGEGAVEVWDVRDVAPKKRMFCASFRLPEGVAFREV